MNSSIKVGTIVLALLASSAALAQEGTQDFAGQSPSPRTRAEVKAELARAQADGLLDRRGETYGGFDPRAFETKRSRAEVLAELEAARRNGTLDRRNHAYGSFATDETPSTRSRAEVKAELAKSLAAGRHLSRGERGG